MKQLANMTIKGPEEYMSKLSALGSNLTTVCKKAVKAGANPVADEMRKNLSSVPEDRFRKLSDGDQFNSASKEQKEDLLNALGITPVSQDKNGVINVKIGFDGYGSYPTKKYPNGVPNALIARAIESGSTVRQKTPFVRKAVNSTKKLAIEEMGKSIESDLKICAL